MARESFFDDLARGLADGSVTRAKALRLMGAALVGGTLTSFGIGGVAAADVRCSEEQRRCGVRCVNLQTNERHCGSCRNRCASNQTCCKGRCVNLQRNERHCGNCFNRCEEGEECVAGVCQGGGCPPDPACTESGGTVNPTTCQCLQACARSEDPCAGTFCCPSPPSPNSECLCFRTTEGRTTCFTPTIVCGNSQVQLCASSSECPPGFACVVGCACGPVCYPLCGTPSPFPFPPDPDTGEPPQFCPPSTTVQAQSSQSQNLRGAGLGP
jgi:stigma-specific protein Stig1